MQVLGHGPRHRFAMLVACDAHRHLAGERDTLLEHAGQALHRVPRGLDVVIPTDSADALRRFLALPDTVCPCGFDEIVTAQLLAARGRHTEAAALFGGTDRTSAVELWRLQRARVYEKSGRRNEALADYQYVSDAWRHADAELQPYVEEARAALKRLSGEPRQ